MVEGRCRRAAGPASARRSTIRRPARPTSCRSSNDRPTVRPPQVSIRFSAAEIATRVDEMAADLAAKLPADTLVVSVLKGSFVFAADLIRALSRAGANWSMDFLTLSSYGTGTETSGNVRIVRDIVDDVRDRDVLLVDDILESGLTLSFRQEPPEGARRASRLGLHPARQAAQAARRARSRLHRLPRPATSSWSATGSTGRTASAACPISAWSRSRRRRSLPRHQAGGAGILRGRQESYAHRPRCATPPSRLPRTRMNRGSRPAARCATAPPWRRCSAMIFPSLTDAERSGARGDGGAWPEPRTWRCRFAAGLRSTS